MRLAKPSALAILILIAAIAYAAPARKLVFKDVETQTREFIGYYKTMKLTPEQEAIKSKALGSMKAVCCKDYSAATCCCPCNFSKSLWGMSNYLIAKEGYGVEELKKAAQAWINYVNPLGFSGDACQTGGCSRPFAQNGCGGMNDRDIRF